MALTTAAALCGLYFAKLDRWYPGLVLLAFIFLTLCNTFGIWALSEDKQDDSTVERWLFRFSAVILVLELVLTGLCVAFWMIVFLYQLGKTIPAP